MREEGQRILRTYESLLKMKDEKLAETAVSLAEKDAMSAVLQAQLEAYQKQQTLYKIHINREGNFRKANTSRFFAN